MFPELREISGGAEFAPSVESSEDLAVVHGDEDTWMTKNSDVVAGRRARVRRKASIVINSLWRRLSRKVSNEEEESSNGKDSSSSLSLWSKRLSARSSLGASTTDTTLDLRGARSGSSCSTEESTAKDEKDKGQTNMLLQAASGAMRISTPVGLNKKRLSRYELVKVEAGCLLFVPLRIHRGLKACSAALEEEDFCFWKTGLPATKAMLTLVLDMDETVLAVVEDAQPNGVAWEGSAASVQEESTIFIRPFFLPLLRSMKAIGCEIIVFSTRSKQFSDALLDLVDPQRDLIDYRLYCHHALVHPMLPSTLCKNLGGLNRDMERCLLIDDSTDAFSLSPNNGWQIAPYSAKLALKRRRGPAADTACGGRRRGRGEGLCEPVVLKGSTKADSSVVECAARDFALLTTYAWVKELIRSNRTVPEFTKCNRALLVESLVRSSNTLVVPETVAACVTGKVGGDRSS